MELLRVAAATVNQTPMDWDGNEARIRQKLEEAALAEVDVVCFPELCLTGYNCEDMFFSLHLTRMAERLLRDLLPFTRGMTAIFGMPVFHLGHMYNCAVVVQNEHILGVNPKKLLPREGVHYESRWFQPGAFRDTQTTRLLDEDVPFGDYRYQLGSLGMAIEICEEAWRSESAAASHALSGVELVLNPSASHFAFGKYQVRETMVANNSRAMQVHYVHTNLLGLESGRLIYDGGTIIAECGRIAARGMRFGFHDGTLLIRDLDLDRARVGKLHNRSERNQEGQSTGTPVIRGESQVSGKEKKPLRAQADRIHFHAPSGQWQLDKNEEFLAAEMLGLFDYLRKSWSRGFMLSLSGGCDSTSIAVLVAQTIACALKELGPEALAARVHLRELPGAKGEARAWISTLLTTVYQATKHSGPVTENAARAVATETGATFEKLDVQEVVDGFIGRAEQLMQRQLSWEKDDLSLQNIQARARAPMIWLLANIKGALLLATSNRSEVAVGYATMDGDTAGGLAPLGGIDKTFLQEWLVWMEKSCTWGLGPLASLHTVNSQAPTAELRPVDQKDETDLMPYPVLSRIERLLIRDRMAPAEILGVLEQEFPACEEKDLRLWLGRFLSLWSRNQWKRERYAPSFQLDDESLDPKTWCRYPILSGGFAREVREITP